MQVHGRHVAIALPAIEVGRTSHGFATSTHTNPSVNPIPILAFDGARLCAVFIVTCIRYYNTSVRLQTDHGHNPIHQLAFLSKTNPPLSHFRLAHGAPDRSHPYERNSFSIFRLAKATRSMRAGSPVDRIFVIGCFGRKIDFESRRLGETYICLLCLVDRLIGSIFANLGHDARAEGRVHKMSMCRWRRYVVTSSTFRP